MFRELTRKNKQITHTESIEILKNQKRGVLSVIGDNQYPYGAPMNHFYNDEDGCIYFHCGKNGHRVDSIKKNDKVSFCIYDEGYRNHGEWALNIKSVVVFGRIEMIEDMETIINISTKLSLKFTQDAAYIQKQIEKHAKSTLLLRLKPEHICGKLVRED